MSSAFTSSGLMRPWYRVKLRSRTWAKLSTKALASSTNALLGDLRGIPPSAVAANAGGFAVGVSGAWSTNVPLGCSPAIRAMSQVPGAPFWPVGPLVMLNDSCTLMPSDSIRPATSGARNMTRPSVSVNITRSPYWPLMVLPCEYFRATVTGALGGKSTTSRVGRLLVAVAISLITSDHFGFGPNSSGRAGRDVSGGALCSVKPSRSSISSMYCRRCCAASFQQRVCQCARPLEVCASSSAMDSRQHSHVISGHPQVRGRKHFRLWRDPRGQLERFAFGSAWPTAVQGRLGSIRHRHQVVDAERLAASVAMELIAAGAEHLAASRAGVHFEKDVSAVFVVFDREAFEKRVASGAGSEVELCPHISMVCLSKRFVKHKTQ